MNEKLVYLKISVGFALFLSLVVAFGILSFRATAVKKDKS